MKISVTGRKGRLGSELVKAGCSPLVVDITKRESIIADIKADQPDVIINCAAFTGVDECEEDKYYREAINVNAFGVNKLRDEFDGLLIHMSTDYIFSGKRGPYSEKYYKYDPVNSYGLTKMAGESVLQTHWKKNSIIVRTTGLYGGSSWKHDFFQLVKQHLTEGQSLRVSRFLRGNQTYIPHLVEALIKLANMEQGFFKPLVVNIASKDIVSRYEFALMIVDMFGWDKKLLTPANIILEWEAKRPTKGGLKTGFAEKLGLPIYTVLEGLEALHEKERP